MRFLIKGFVETLIVGVISLIAWSGLNIFILPHVRSVSSSRDAVYIFFMIALAVMPLAVFYERLRRAYRTSPMGLGSMAGAIIGAGMAMLIIFYLAAISAWQ